MCCMGLNLFSFSFPSFSSPRFARWAWSGIAGSIFPPSPLSKVFALFSSPLSGTVPAQLSSNSPRRASLPFFFLSVSDRIRQMSLFPLPFFPLYTPFSFLDKKGQYESRLLCFILPSSFFRRSPYMTVALLPFLPKKFSLVFTEAGIGTLLFAFPPLFLPLVDKPILPYLFFFHFPPLNHGQGAASRPFGSFLFSFSLIPQQEGSDRRLPPFSFLLSGPFSLGLVMLFLFFLFLVRDEVSEPRRPALPPFSPLPPLAVMEFAFFSFYRADTVSPQCQHRIFFPLPLSSLVQPGTFVGRYVFPLLFPFFFLPRRVFFLLLDALRHLL